MFSPIVATADATASAIVMLPAFAALIASTSSPTESATSAIILTRPWKWSLRATKSVSEFTSTIAPFCAATNSPIRPSAATRPAFLAAFDNPFLRSQSTAASMSPLVSASAVLQSIMPAPVLSRSSFTIAAVIFAIVLDPSDGQTRDGRRSPQDDPSSVPALFRHKLFRLGDPSFDAGRQPDLFADPLGIGGAKLGDLPVVEHAEIV